MSMPDKDDLSEITSGPSEAKLLIQSARIKLDLFFAKNFWTFDELENVMSYYWYDDNEVAVMNETILRRRKERKSLNEEGFREDFRSKTLIQFRKLLFSEKMDTITRLGAMDPFQKTTMVSDAFNERTPTFFLKNFETWGFGVITGLPGKGKTNFACTMMDMALHYHNPNNPKVKFRVVTNVMIVGDLPEGLQYTTSFRQLLLFTIQNSLEGYKTLIFLDEMPQFFNKKRTMSNTYLSFEKVLFLLRKFGGNLLAIVQRDADIPTVMKEFSENFFQKLNPKTLMFTRGRPNGRGSDMYIIGSVPETTLHYDTNDTASFDVDVDLEALAKYIASLGSMRELSQQLTFIRDYLKTATMEVMTTKEEKLGMKYMRDRIGANQNEIASALGITEEKVSKAIGDNHTRKESREPMLRIKEPDDE